MRDRLQIPWKRFRRRVRSLALRPVTASFTGVLGRLSLPRAQAIGRRLGGLYWLFCGSNRRRRMDANLRTAFPDLGGEERRHLARRNAEHLGLNLAECMHVLHQERETVLSYIDVEGWEHVEAARGGARPIIFVMGHCGNWELLGPTINGRGVGMLAVARRLQDSFMEREIIKLRRRFGTDTITRGHPRAARLLLHALRGSGSIALLVDQDIRRTESVWVPFFGKTASTPVGPAQMAIKHRATVIPAFVERLDSGRHLARFLEPLDLPDDPERATALMTRAIEDQVRRRPEQWVWAHDRWRRRPPRADSAPQS